MKKRTLAKTPMDSAGAHERQLNRPGNETEHLIATKAYELYEQRGRIDGYDLDDWLKAEAIINGSIE
ncbi:MAG: DUF2934 domain-containing protein [Nitrospirota bacterium]|nr:DUF2934 domain-containing protein [Nitrospirota bacterium]MDE3218605.1 DUF2934 domain-containing protein [Nitrospirota bacterium]